MKRTTTNKNVAETPVSAPTPVSETTIPPQPSSEPPPATSVNGAVAESIDSFAAPLPSSDVLNDFDIEEFRADTSMPVSQPVEDSRTVLVMKPKSLQPVYIHPHWKMGLYLLPAEFGKRDAHLVLPKVAQRCPKQCRWYMARAYADQNGNFYLWPIPLENKTGKPNTFVESALRQIDLSIGKWCHFETNMDIKVYEAHAMIDQPPAPNWPDGGIENLVKLAFRDRIIRDINHPHLTVRSYKLSVPHA
jgi:hypothetical protein